MKKPRGMEGVSHTQPYFDMIVYITARSLGSTIFIVNVNRNKLSAFVFSKFVSTHSSKWVSDRSSNRQFKRCQHLNMWNPRTEEKKKKKKRVPDEHMPAYGLVSGCYVMIIIVIISIQLKMSDKKNGFRRFRFSVRHLNHLSDERKNNRWKKS